MSIANHEQRELPILFYKSTIQFDDSCTLVNECKEVNLHIDERVEEENIICEGGGLKEKQGMHKVHLTVDVIPNDAAEN